MNHPNPVEVLRVLLHQEPAIEKAPPDQQDHLLAHCLQASAFLILLMQHPPMADAEELEDDQRLSRRATLFLQHYLNTRPASPTGASWSGELQDPFLTGLYQLGQYMFTLSTELEHRYQFTPESYNEACQAALQPTAPRMLPVEITQPAIDFFLKLSVFALTNPAIM